MRFRNLAFGLACLTALAAVQAGCGDDDDSSGGSSTGGTAGTGGSGTGGSGTGGSPSDSGTD